MAVRYGLWNDTQTTVMLSHVYDTDWIRVLGMLKSMCMTVSDRSVLVDYLNPRSCFVLDQIDTMRTTDTFVWTKLSNMTTFSVQVEKLQDDEVGHSLSDSGALAPDEIIMDKYVRIEFQSHDPNISDVVYGPLIKIYYTAADLDLNGDGGADDPEDLNAGEAESPHVAADAFGNAFAVWDQWDGSRSCIFADRYVHGSGWTGAWLIDSVSTYDCYNPRVAVDGSGNAIAVWQQSDGTRTNIWSNRYVEPDIIPPSLSLDDFSEGLTTETPTVTVSGTTEPGVTLSLDGILVAIESDGSFSCTIALVEGINTITATATDASDNSATVSLDVTYVNPVPGLEEELNTTQDDMDAVEEEFDATRDDLNATQDELEATDEELSSTIGDLDDMRSQNLVLLLVLAVFAILVVVMSVMFFSLRKKIADMGGKSVGEETPPPPQG